MAIRLLVAALVLGILVGPSRAGEPGRAPASAAPVDPKVQVALISETAGIEPGASFWVGLRQRIAPGWHTYWINPGDSGEAATIRWALPAGFEAGELVWPHPERLPVGPLMSYGYTREVVLLARLTAPSTLAPGASVALRGHAAWLVCEKTCIPEEADVALTLPVVTSRAGADPTAAPAIAQARRAVPVPSPWPTSFSADADSVVLSVAAPREVSARATEVSFFPTRWGLIDHAAPQVVSTVDGGITLRMTRGPLAAATEGPVDGVLVVSERLDQGLTRQAFAIRATPSAASIVASSGAGSSTPGGAVSLVSALGLALAGGLVLNLMPCVLPVLSVKALALVSHADTPPRVLRRHGLAYAAGVLASFGALAGSLIALRAGGAQIGWGFQLQSPIVVVGLAYLFFALGLSLSGVLVLGGRITGVGQALAARPGYAGSFFTGALAAVAATPCTAPFMGVALGFAVTQPAPTALLVFEALALGLALPYLALSLMPSWRRALPRPGPWTERLKQLMAFPLYASVAWLVWVVSRQTGPEGVAAVLGGLVLIAFAAWLHQSSRAAAPRWRAFAGVAAAAAVVGALFLGHLAGASSPAPAAASTTRAMAAEPWSPKRLAELTAQGKPVFVNFTAAWCITCLVNERVALHSPAVAQAFARKGVVYLEADWTSRSAAIATALGSFGRSGVPLYVVYPPGAGRAGGPEPIILPQVLSEGTIIDTIEKEIP